MNKRQRMLGPDIVRVIAICCVLFIHMLSYAADFNEGLRTPKWCLYVALHYLAMICVPLFLMLTGFFASKKKLSKTYYVGLLPVLASYSAIAVVCVVLRWMSGESISFLRGLLLILDFGANDYAWYVEMYIGLFLIIPFLNMVADALTGKKQWHLLLGVMLALTALPEISNSVIVSGTRVDVIPDYWTAVYPITYYFIGAYIYRFRPRLKKSVCLLLTAAALLLQTGFCFAFSAKEYAWWVFHGFGALPVAFTAYMVFLLFYDITQAPSAVAVPVHAVALCSFEMYLISYITDKLVYRYLPLPGIAAWLINIVICFAGAYILRLVLVPACSAAVNGVKRIIKDE